MYLCLALNEESKNIRKIKCNEMMHILEIEKSRGEPGITRNGWLKDNILDMYILLMYLVHDGIFNRCMNYNGDPVFVSHSAAFHKCTNKNMQ